MYTDMIIEHMHGIYPRTSDTVGSFGKMANLTQTKAKPGDVFERKQRIAVVIWSN